MGEKLAGQSSDTFLLAGFTIFLCVLVHLIYKIFLSRKKNAANEQETENILDSNTTAAPTPAVTEKKDAKSKKRPTQWKGKKDFSHPWLLKSLKGHPGTVLHMDFSANGKFIAAVCDDGSIMLWDIRDLSTKDHKTLRVNLEFDHASHVAWSPDSKAFIIHTVHDNRLSVYKIEKKKDGTIGSATRVLTFDKAHEDNIVGFGISSNGKYMMTCSSKTDLIIWDLKGQKLDRLDTTVLSTHTAKISPCGRFVAVAGLTPEAKVLEVGFGKNGEFKEVKKAYDLKGHSGGIYDLDFDVNTTHMATVSTDGTWKLHHTNIDHTVGASPHVLETGTYSQTANPPRIALSPDAAVLAVSVDSSIEFYDTYTGKLYDTVENIFSGLINFMKFDATGKYLFCCGDKAVRILHNVCGYQTTIDNCMRNMSSKQSSATVERLKKTIQDCKETLATFGK